MDISARLEQVRTRLTSAAQDAGREASSVRLIAVSKLQPIEAIRAAYAAGQRDFGENYVQELVSKAEALSDLQDIRWHMIGHLQRNKARSVVEHAAVIHAVHSVELARELGKRAQGHELSSARRLDVLEGRVSVLVEVNVGGETQKSGCSEQELGSVLDAVARETTLRLVGLMCVPPHTEDPAGARPYFDRLVALRDAHGGEARLPELSMGMTADLEHAVSAGATMVRIGTAIFGERPPRGS